jgi:hypothetical protein
MASTTVNFNLKTAGYVNYANQTLTFTLLSAGAEASSGTQDYVVLPGTVTATSDANGDGSVSLFRNGKSGIDSVYEVVFPNRERAKFIIPAGSSTIELATLIVDNVPSGSSTQQSSVYDKAIQRANHTGTQTISTISDAGTIASQNSNAVNIDGGAIDGAVIGANSAAAGTFAALTSAALTSTSISVSDGDITNVGDINCDTISSDDASTGLNIIFDGTDTGDNKITLTDNLANALDITESTNSYLKFTTTNSGEKVVISKDLDISGTTTAAAVTGTTITASTKFVGAIDGVVGGNTPAAGTFNSISVSDGNITNAGDINCDSISADDAATGLNVVFDGTDTGDNKITLTDNLANALDITESSNSYLKFTTTNSGEKVVFGKDLDISGDHDLIIGTSTGTKIGTATGQKIGFFNATPVIQPATTGTTTGTSGGSGNALHANATITGNVGSTAYTVGDIVKALKTLGLLAE